MDEHLPPPLSPVSTYLRLPLCQWMKSVWNIWFTCNSLKGLISCLGTVHSPVTPTGQATRWCPRAQAKAAPGKGLTAAALPEPCWAPSPTLGADGRTEEPLDSTGISEKGGGGDWGGRRDTTFYALSLADGINPPKAFYPPVPMRTGNPVQPVLQQSLETSHQT